MRRSGSIAFPLPQKQPITLKVIATSVLIVNRALPIIIQVAMVITWWPLQLPGRPRLPLGMSSCPSPGAKPGGLGGDPIAG